jgi:hypothetical protein
VAKSAVDVITDAIEHTRKQLLDPFRFGQWARLALLALATGELSSGGSCKSVGNLPTKTHGSQSLSFAQSNLLNPSDILRGIDPALIASIVLVLVMCGLVLMVVWIYVSSISRFMLFESVLRKNCDALGAGWNRWQEPGMRYFWWQLALSLIGLFVASLLFIPLLIPILITMRNHQQPSPEVFFALLPMVFVFGAFALVMLLINVLTKDFIVPMMALEGGGVLDGWRRLFAMMKTEKGQYAGYVGMKALLAIGAAVVFGILSVIGAMIALIPVAIVAGIAVIAGKAAGLGWNAFTITAAIVAGAILLAVIMYAVAVMCVPVAVFFPAYAMYFFAERYPPLYGQLHPPVPAATLPPAWGVPQT